MCLCAQEVWFSRSLLREEQTSFTAVVDLFCGSMRVRAQEVSKAVRCLERSDLQEQ